MLAPVAILVVFASLGVAALRFGVDGTGEPGWAFGGGAEARARESSIA